MNKNYSSFIILHNIVFLKIKKICKTKSTEKTEEKAFGNLPKVVANPYITCIEVKPTLVKLSIVQPIFSVEYLVLHAIPDKIILRF